MEQLTITTSSNDIADIVSVIAKLGVRYRTEYESRDSYCVVSDSVKSIGYSEQSRKDSESELRKDIETFFSVHSKRFNIHDTLTNETFKWTLRSRDGDVWTYIKETDAKEYLVFSIEVENVSDMEILIGNIKQGMYDRYSFELTDEQINEYLEENKTPEMSYKTFDTAEFERYSGYLSNKIINKPWVLNNASIEEITEFFTELKEKASEFGYVYDSGDQ